MFSSKFVKVVLFVAFVLFVAVAPRGLTDQTFAPAAEGLQAASQQSVIAGSISNSLSQYAQQVNSSAIDLSKVTVTVALFAGALFGAVLVWLVLCSIGRKNIGKVVAIVLLGIAVLSLAACAPTISCPNGYTPLADSATANNPNGLCQGPNGQLVAGLVRVFQAEEEANKKADAAVKEIVDSAKCTIDGYNKTGMGTSALYGCTVGGTTNFGTTDLYQNNAK